MDYKISVLPELLILAVDIRAIIKVAQSNSGSLSKVI